MARCFCGCGKKVPYRMRGINERGGIIQNDVIRVERLLLSGLSSPNAQMFVHDGLLICDILADAVHRRIDPGPEFEQETAGFMAFAREHFIEAAIGRRLRQTGMTPEEASAAIRSGGFDPFADIDYPSRIQTS